MAIATGQIAVFGADGTITLSGSGMLTSSQIGTQSLGFSQSYQTSDFVDGSGRRRARHYHTPEQKLTAEFIPWDPTNPGNLATLKSAVKLPAAGSTVAISSSGSPSIDGNWNFSGNGTIRPNQKGFLVISMDLERVGEDGSNNAAALTSTP